MKQIIIIVVAVIGVIGAAVILGGSEEEAAGAPSNNFYGQETAAVTLTEYGDFECPACAQFFPIIAQVKEEYKDQIRFEFRHFPLVSIHPNAIAAHRAAEAAGLQGQFWEMHDLLYQRQNAWRTQSAGSAGFANTNAAETFRGYAEELGLDIERYNTDISSSATIGTINADISRGQGEGAESTPTFFINGELIEDTNQLATVEGFSAVIDEALAEANGELSASEESSAEEATRPEEEATEE